VRRIAEVIAWTGEIATVPEGRIPVPYHFDQGLDTNSRRIREELGFTETVRLHEALERTIAWERTNPPEQWSALGILDDEFEQEPLS
jgi:nucleoside-diphosphate-sugar epimerase